MGPCRWVLENGKRVCRNTRTSMKSRYCKAHEASHKVLVIQEKERQFQAKVLAKQALAKEKKDIAELKQKRAKAEAVAVEAKQIAQAQIHSGGVENLAMMIAQLQRQLEKAQNEL